MDSRLRLAHHAEFGRFLPLPRPSNAVAALAAILAFLATPAAWASERFQFKFNPPPGTSFVRIFTETGIFETTLGPFTIDTVTTEQFTFRRGDDGRLECDYKINAHQATINTQPISPIFEPEFIWAGMDRPVTFLLDEKGRSEAVRGHAELAADIIARIEQEAQSPEHRQLLEQARFSGRVAYMLDEHRLMADYLMMMGNMASLLDGQYLSIGQTLPLISMVPDEHTGATHRANLELKAERVIRQGEKTGVEILFATEPTPPLMSMIAREIESRLSTHALAFGEIKSMAMKLRNNYVVEPSTMLPRSQTFHNELRMNVVTPDGKAVHLKGSIRSEGRFF